jgi:hypothetical protein
MQHAAMGADEAIDSEQTVDEEVKLALASITSLTENAVAPRVYDDLAFVTRTLSHLPSVSTIVSEVLG